MPRKPRLNTLPAKARTEPRDMRAVVVIPTVEQLAGDALSVLHYEMARLRRSAMGSLGLTDNESRKLTRYVRSLVQLRRVEETADPEDDTSRLSDEELLRELLQSFGLTGKQAETMMARLLKAAQEEAAK